jgi:Thioredoxin-like domain
LPKKGCPTGHGQTTNIRTSYTKHLIPLKQYSSQEAAKKIFRSAIQQHALLFTDKESSSHAPSLVLLSEIAKQFKGKAIFVSVPTTESRVFEFFGITEDQVPAFVVADMGAESGDSLPLPACLPATSYSLLLLHPVYPS